jgi:hypothetical protein
MLFFLALILAIVSYNNICTTACEATHRYLLFTLPFEFIGFPFFISLLILHLFAWRSPFLSRIKENLVSAALGAEFIFITIQKFQIGSWCPLCLSIAATLFLSAIALAWENHLKRIEVMKISTFAEEPMKRQPISLFAAALAGFVLALVGISHESPLESGQKTITAEGLENAIRELQ